MTPSQDMMDRFDSLLKTFNIENRKPTEGEVEVHSAVKKFLLQETQRVREEDEKGLIEYAKANIAPHHFNQEWFILVVKTYFKELSTNKLP